MKVLSVDVGGTNVKILATGQAEPRKFPSGPTLTPRQMVAGVKKLAGDWKYDVVSIGYPGRVVGDLASTEPRTLAPGCRLGTNANAFIGGFRMWEPATTRQPQTPKPTPDGRAKKAKAA